MTTYSVQQIKFELLSYIKEFGGDAMQWHVGTSEDAPNELFETLRVDPNTDIWLWKPALTAAAADLVAKYMVDRCKASRVETRDPGHCVFLYQRTS